MSMTEYQSRESAGGMFGDIEAEKRRLHLLLAIDVSSSMAGARIAQVNKAGGELFQALMEVARKNREVQILIRVITFGSAAEWKHTKWTEIEKVSWVELVARGSTNFGKAITKIDAAFDVEHMGTSGCQPQVVLLSDGRPTDDWKLPLASFGKNSPWGANAVRSGVAVEGADMQMIHTWRGNTGGIIKEASNAAEMAEELKLVTLASAGFGSQVAGQQQSMEDHYQNIKEAQDGQARGF